MEGYSVHLIITRDRHSKLGDYCRKRGDIHQITINSTLDPELFFFVLTHELAHLTAFEKYGRRIAPHGPEWKQTYREMLLESISVYDTELKPLILHYARSPKANFMAAPALVKYFEQFTLGMHESFVEELRSGDHFSYRQSEYRLEHKIKKNYLCLRLSDSKKYIFRPLAKVIKLK